MSKPHKSSHYLEKAEELLEQIKGKPLTISERKSLSIQLSALLLEEASRTMTKKEKKIQNQLSRLMKDPVGKSFTTAMTDQCFRSHSNKRIANQMIYLLHQFGVPEYLNWVRKIQLFSFKGMGTKIAQWFIPLAIWLLRRETTRVILPGEPKSLTHHLQERRKEGVRINLNHLGEAILSEQEALKRLEIYLKDLENPDIDYMSVKISTIFSQINLLAFDETVDAIAEGLKRLYRAAINHSVSLPCGSKRPKFINLDMEEYRDLRLTVTAFRKVLDDPEFQSYSAGIVLQAYLPDSHYFQKELTEWAKKRLREGGAPIKIRIVKGANLAMEQFEASLKGWAQAPYKTKIDVDANYKRMVIYGCMRENARAVRLGIASHNLFDIAFAMLLRAENEIESYVEFEMLEGMADSIRKVVQRLTGEILLYCPVATKEEFQHAIAYLIRRLDENTGSENFLRYMFGLKVGSDSWKMQVSIFSKSCDLVSTVASSPRREQNRQLHPHLVDSHAPFENEADTDFSLLPNQNWAKNIIHKWEHYKPNSVPLVIGGNELYANEEGIGHNPSRSGAPYFNYAKAKKSHIDEALKCAKEISSKWAETTIEHRSQLLSNIAQKLRERRGELIGIMMLDAGKTLIEADPEVSEAIDFAEYYGHQIKKLTAMKDISWKPKGTVLIASPWNFPCAIPAGGICAALAAGNCVLFKPASDAILVAWHLCQAIWDAGISKEVLQFIPCSGDEVGQDLISDQRINSVILTGGTSTAQKFLSMRPNLDLAAETGGKNAIIITALSDRDLAIKDLLQSAFGHSGQKCSAASLAILEAEVYDDPHFLQQLCDAAKSLKVGSPWDLSTKIGPLIHAPRDVLKRGLTTLEPGERWLLEPIQDPNNPCLWSPGIKLHVQLNGFTHKTELFGPVLGLMRATNLSHALELANAVPYGLTSGLFSLDEREQTIWAQRIEAGNLYINRTITGAIVRRQPFGGTKLSSFGNGSKAGGPNYLCEFMKASQSSLPQEKYPINEWVNNLTPFLAKWDFSPEKLGLWTASISNYAYWWKKLHEPQDPSNIVGQDNFFRYIPRKKITLRLSSRADPFDSLRICAAALTCGAGFEISFTSRDAKDSAFHWSKLVPIVRVIDETEQQFFNRIRDNQIQRIRLLEAPSNELYQIASEKAAHIVKDPVLANGRFELLHYLRELSLSIDYHRYGNLGSREGEKRKALL